MPRSSGPGRQLSKEDQRPAARPLRRRRQNCAGGQCQANEPGGRTSPLGVSGRGWGSGPQEAGSEPGGGRVSPPVPGGCWPLLLRRRRWSAACCLSGAVGESGRPAWPALLAGPCGIGACGARRGAASAPPPTATACLGWDGGRALRRGPGGVMAQGRGRGAPAPTRGRRIREPRGAGGDAWQAT